jgi:similar to stage IV sporulation protein
LERFSDEARGYAVLRAVGAEPTRLIDRCAAENIDFWSAYPEDELTLVFKVRLGQAERVVGFAEQCRCEIALLEKSGFPVEVKKLRKRYVLWILPLLLLAILAASSFFIWKIEITGAETVSEIEILNALEDSGVRIGSFWPALTSDSVRSLVLLKIPELKWLSVSVFGSRALVEVRERTEAPALAGEDEAVKLVAREPGIIESVSVLRGYPLMRKGQTAAQNDTLITGAVPSSFAGTKIVRAEGSVMARTWHEISAVVPLVYSRKEYTGEKKTRYALVIGGTRINFYTKSGISDSDCDNIIREHRLGIAGLFELPVTIVREVSERYVLTDALRTEKAAELRLRTRVNAELETRLGEAGEITSAEFTFAIAGDCAVGTLRAECRQDIAKRAGMTAGEINAASAAGEDQNTA